MPRRPVRRRRSKQLGLLPGIPKPVLWGVPLAILAVLIFSKRKEIAVAAKKVLNEAQKKILATVIPAQGEAFIDYAFELGPKYGINPLFLLSFVRVESGFRLRPDQWGDEFPRCVSRYAKDPARAALASKLPGVKMIPNHTFKNPKGEMQTCDAWVPAKGNGWGLGPMQLDWMAHPAFFSRADAKDARTQMEYAITNVIQPAIDAIKKANPGISQDKLFEGVIAAYNAGAGGAAQAIKAGKDLTKITAAEWYIPKVREYMDKLSTLFGGNSTDLFA
jgi:hypothetical protein